MALREVWMFEDCGHILTWTPMGMANIYRCPTCTNDNNGWQAYPGPRQRERWRGYGA